MKLTLTITLDQATGGIEVSGEVINNKVIAYGMLDAARDAIRDHIEKSKSGLIPVRGSLNGKN